MRYFLASCCTRIISSTRKLRVRETAAPYTPRFLWETTMMYATRMIRNLRHISLMIRYPSLQLCTHSFFLACIIFAFTAVIHRSSNLNFSQQLFASYPKIHRWRIAELRSDEVIRTSNRIKTENLDRGWKINGFHGTRSQWVNRLTDWIERIICVTTESSDTIRDSTC